MVSFTAMAQELQRKVRGQQTPIPYEQSDYEQMILDGIRKLSLPKIKRQIKLASTPTIAGM